jgi:hypothetical protein
VHSDAENQFLASVAKEAYDVSYSKWFLKM